MGLLPSSRVPAPPPPSGQELAIMSQQRGRLAKQRGLTNELKPFLYKRMGIEIGADGVLRKTPKGPEDPLVAAYKSRQQAALEGGVVSPGLERGLAGIRSKFAGRTGTIGQQTEQGLGTMENVLRDRAIKNQLGMGEQMLESREGLLSNIEARKAMGMQNMDTNAKLSQMYGPLLAPYQNVRQNIYAQATAGARGQAQANAAGVAATATVIALLLA